VRTPGQLSPCAACAGRETTRCGAWLLHGDFIYICVAVACKSMPALCRGSCAAACALCAARDSSQRRQLLRLPRTPPQGPGGDADDGASELCARALRSYRAAAIGTPALGHALQRLQAKLEQEALASVCGDDGSSSGGSGGEGDSGSWSGGGAGIGGSGEAAAQAGGGMVASMPRQRWGRRSDTCAPSNACTQVLPGGSLQCAAAGAARILTIAPAAPRPAARRRRLPGRL
jgi:hypothetical protein